MQNKYIALIMAYVVYVNCMHTKVWENEKKKIMCVLNWTLMLLKSMSRSTI